MSAPAVLLAWECPEGALGLTDRLRRDGHEVAWVPTGADALIYLLDDCRPCRAVVAALRLRGVSGLELTGAARLRRVPILVVGAAAPTGDQRSVCLEIVSDALDRMLVREHKSGGRDADVSPQVPR